MFGLSLHHNIDTRKNSLVNENIFIRFLFAGQNDYRFFEIIIGDIWIFVVILGWYRKDRKRTGIAVGEPKKKQVIKQLVKLLPFRECHLMSISVDSTRITPPCGQFEISRKYMDLLLFLKLEE